MTKEQAQKVLDEMQGVRPELLDNEAKKLFEAIMKIADERDDLKKELKKKDDKIEKYINILATNDMLHVKECEEKDQIIEQMTYYIMNLDIDEDICKRVNCDTNSGELDCKNCIKQCFKNKVKEL